MVTARTLERPDTHQMVVIHRIFRRGFGQLKVLSGRVPPGDRERAAVLTRHAEFLLNGLHHHHRAEDEHLWPRLLERAQPDASLIARMTDQHRVVGGHIDHLIRILPAWRGAPGGAEVPGVLDELTHCLTAHLDEEEQKILPLVRDHITAAEWQQMGDAAFAKFTNAEKLIALGQLLDVATPEEAAGFLADLPTPVRVMWRLVGRRRYAGYMSQVNSSDSRGTQSSSG